jgi:hypothetical protein
MALASRRILRQARLRYADLIFATSAIGAIADEWTSSQQGRVVPKSGPTSNAGFRPSEPSFRQPSLAQAVEQVLEIGARLEPFDLGIPGSR